MAIQTYSPTTELHSIEGLQDQRYGEAYAEVDGLIQFCQKPGARFKGRRIESAALNQVLITNPRDSKSGISAQRVPGNNTVTLSQWEELDTPDGPMRHDWVYQLSGEGHVAVYQYLLDGEVVIDDPMTSQDLDVLGDIMSDLQERSKPHAKADRVKRILSSIISPV